MGSTCSAMSTICIRVLKSEDKMKRNSQHTSKYKLSSLCVIGISKVFTMKAAYYKLLLNVRCVQDRISTRRSLMTQNSFIT